MRSLRHCRIRTTLTSMDGMPAFSPLTRRCNPLALFAGYRESLNERGIPTARGAGDWSAVQVARVLTRAPASSGAPDRKSVV